MKTKRDQRHKGATGQGGNFHDVVYYRVTLLCLYFDVYLMLFKVETLCLLQVTLPSNFAHVNSTIWSELS